MNSVRHRFLTGYTKKSGALPTCYEDKINSKKQTYSISSNHFISHLIFLIICFISIVYFEKILPSPILIKDESAYVNRFIAERARNYLLNLTKFGHRPVGSYSNEIIAVNILSKSIENIIVGANKIHTIRYDVQKVSGSFQLQFFDGMTNVYKNVQNVIVKIGPSDKSNFSLLVNCHFDTAIDSPGASDDAAGCAVMLEMLRVISKMRKPLHHDIIFLFNGAEESFMQASHGFITQHEWAINVKAVINLEACGAGGKEILFQAAFDNPWLLQAYSEAVPYPLGSSLAQEIFGSGFIPGDTDYRIFRDFGKIPGLDFAWFFNGYVYHNKMDDVNQIPLGTLQHTGDNILPLILRLVNSDYLSLRRMKSKGNLVYFDFFGQFLISVKEYIAIIINVVIVIACIFSIRYNMKKHFGELCQERYIKLFGWGVIHILCSWLITLLCVIFIAYFITLLNCSLSWYAKPYWIFFLYTIPTYIVPILFALRFRKKYKKEFSIPEKIFKVYNDCNLFIFSIISIFLTLLRIRSNFMISIWLGFSLLNLIVKNEFGNKYYGGNRYLWLHTFCLLIPFAFNCYTINGIIMLLIPIMGRSGCGNHIELIFSLIMSVVQLLMFSFYVPLSVLVFNIKNIVKFFLALFVGAIFIILCTPLGFPYSGDISSPAPQRYIILHVDRVFYDINGKIRKNDSGFWIPNMDENSPQIVSKLIPEIAQAKLVKDDCENELYCGLPYRYPVMSIMWKTHWFATDRLSLPSTVELHRTNHELRFNNIQRFSFSAFGPNHMTLFISPYSNVKLKTWSFEHGIPLEGPRWKDRSTYFIFYSSGSNESEILDFWLDLEVMDNNQKPIVDIVLTGYFVHGPHQTSPQLQKLFSQFPSWAVTSGWTSAYKSYKF